MTTTVGKAPAKILLCGEHAVLYGMPSIAMAVNRFATTHITSKQSRVAVLLTLCDMKKTYKITLTTLQSVKDRIFSAYQEFISGTLNIKEVLQTPADLFHMALISFLESCMLSLPDGLSVKVTSHIPIGCGMGSSAASTISLLRALLHYFRIEKGLEWLSSFSKQIEHFQHGKSSGVDTHICSHGGCAYFQCEKTPLVLPLPKIPLWLVHTGRPKTTTGEAVSYVRKMHEKSTIWNEFGDIAKNFAKAMHQDQTKLPELIRQNHALLCAIGVVPEKVQRFIHEIELSGNAAKICGSGAVFGENGGIVLVASQHPPKELCSSYRYSYFPLQGELSGATAYSC